VIGYAREVAVTVCGLALGIGLGLVLVFNCSLTLMDNWFSSRVRIINAVVTVTVIRGPSEWEPFGRL